MEVNGHFMQMLLLSLMMVSASHARHSRKICPGQRIPVGSDCSRYREYCSVGAVCEQSGQEYTCRIPVGSDCSGYREYCSVGAVCEQSGQEYTCKLSVGGNCGTNETLCMEELVCDSSGQCKVDIGDECSDDNECKTGSICFPDVCVCGGRLNGSEGVLTSPNYPENYPEKARCVWIISAPEDHVVKLTFTDFEVETSETAGTLRHNDCPYDYLQLRNGPEAAAPSLDQICGKGDPAPVQSSSNVLQLVFVSDESYSFSGFRLEYTFELPGP